MLKVTSLRHLPKQSIQQDYQRITQVVSWKVIMQLGLHLHSYFSSWLPHIPLSWYSASTWIQSKRINLLWAKMPKVGRQYNTDPFRSFISSVHYSYRKFKHWDILFSHSKNKWEAWMESFIEHYYLQIIILLIILLIIR